MHPAILAITILSFILIPLLNIRYSIFLIIFFAIMVPYRQGFEIYSLNFNIFRLLILAGWIKIIFTRNLKLGKMEKTDKAIIYWVIVSFIVYIIRENNIDAVINRLGFAYNAIGVYFLYRIIIRRKEELGTVFNTLAIVSAVIAVFVLIEQLTGRNLLFAFGASHEFTQNRLGMLRAQGPFGHPINAGLFGATMFPICFSMWRHKWGSAFLGFIGTLSASVIIIASGSMTSYVAGVAGFAALLFWPLRNKMRTVRYGILFTAVLIQFVMISPIWIFINKMALIKGSSGFHRFELVNNLFNHLNEWFLIGVSSTDSWGEFMHDKANQYYLVAVTGGFFTLALFIMVIVYNFNIIGEKIKTLTDISSRKKFWALGSVLFANVVGFFGISYWDQMLFVWYVFLALITSTCVINEERLFAVNEISNIYGREKLSSLKDQARV